MIAINKRGMPVLAGVAYFDGKRDILRLELWLLEFSEAAWSIPLTSLVVSMAMATHVMPQLTSEPSVHVETMGAFNENFQWFASY